MIVMSSFLQSCGAAVRQLCGLAIVVAALALSASPALATTFELRFDDLGEGGIFFQLLQDGVVQVSQLNPGETIHRGDGFSGLGGLTQPLDFEINILEAVTGLVSDTFKVTAVVFPGDIVVFNSDFASDTETGPPPSLPTTNVITETGDWQLLVTATSGNGDLIHFEFRSDVAEPSTLILLGFGLLGLAAWGRRKTA